MSVLRKKWKRKKENFRSVFHQEDFLRESDSSIEKALFWSSNFLTVPSSGKSLLNLKSSQKRCLDERLNRMRMTVNVGGEKFVIPYKTIVHYPNTLLASKEIGKYFDQKRKEYFFDRDPDMFRYVFNFYKNDKIHYPMDECIQAFMDELKFFKIPLEIIKDCCYAEFHLEFENNTNCIKCAKQKRRPLRNQDPLIVGKSKPMKKPDMRTRIREILCEPSSSKQAKVLAYALLVCVFFNILGFILETLPCTKSSRKCGEIYPRVFFTFDLICVLIFTFEFFITLVVQKKRKAFFCCVENVLFFGSLVPAYISWLLTVILGFGKIPVYVDDSLKALRIFRVVKIAKTSSHLRETVASIAAATRGLALVVATCIIVIVVLSVLIHHLDDSFPHVPMGMWYFVVTLTSLGYGDCVPSTAQGKVLGIIGVLLGVLVVSLPVPIIQNKLGANLDDVGPEPDEIVLDNLYPPDYADRQRRMSRMISMEHQVLNLRLPSESEN